MTPTASWSCAVYGLPVAQGRPRATVIAGHAHVYDARTSRDWKRLVAWTAAQQRPAKLFDGPLDVAMHFRLPRPKSLPKRVRHHIKRPDLDNLAKAVKDALRGVVYRDDAQVIWLLVAKEYGEAPGVRISVRAVP